MRSRTDWETPETAIDVSPLIDMVFILLIFFMVSSSFVKDLQIELERPQASSATSASSKALRIFIDQNQQVYLNGAQVQVWMLQSRIREIFQQDQSKSILVVTDKKVSAQKLLEVVDNARLAGAKDIGVATVQEVGE